MGRFAEGKKPLSEAVARGGNDLDRAPTIRTSLHINLENPLEARRPLHRRTPFGRCAVFGWLCGLRTPTPAGRRDPGPVGAVGCKHPVEAGQVQSRRRDERGQPGDEIQRLEDHVGSAVGRWVRFAQSARSALRETISASHHGTGFSACSRCRRARSGTGAFLKRAIRHSGLASSSKLETAKPALAALADGRCNGTAARACRAGRL
jgi:hypothetical protein